MTSAGPWSVKGIDPKAREIAKDLARRSGQTLGEWLNTRIIDPEGEGAPDQDFDAAAPPPQFYAPQPPRARAAVEPAPRLTVRPENRSEPRPEPRRWTDPRADERAALRAETSAQDMRRVADALGELSARIEAAEQRSTLAIGGIDQHVAGVLSRMQDLEREHTSVASTCEGQLHDVRGVQAKLGERLRRMDEQEGPRVEAMKALEAALGRIAGQVHEGEMRAQALAAESEGRIEALDQKIDAAAERAEAGADADLVEQRLTEIAERLDQAEARTSLAVRALETSFTGLDRRMADMRRDPAEAEAALDQRFATLATDLSQQVESSRAEMVERLTALIAGAEAASGRLDRIEPQIQEMAGQVAASEQRSAKAIDAMGREVVKIAQGLGGRVAASEARQVESEKRIGGEMARIADAVEARLRHNDSTQADALEKLGGEIARIAEKLADRIASSERRSVLSAEDLSEKFAHVTEKLDARHNETAAEIALRLHESEARTAKLLADAPVVRPAPEASVAPSVAPEPSPVTAAAEPARPAEPEIDVFSAIAPNFFAAPTASPPLQPLALNLGPAVEIAHPAVAPVTPADDFHRGFDDPFAAPGEQAPFASAFDDFDGGVFKDEPHDIEAHEVETQAGVEPPPFTAGPFDAEGLFGPAPPHSSPEAPVSAHEPAELTLLHEASPVEAAFAAPAAPAELPRPSSTRELIEQARAAARQASEAKARAKGRGGREATPLTAAPPAPSVAAPGFEGEGKAFGASMPWRKKREEGATLRTAVLASVLASSVVAVGVGVLGLVSGDGSRTVASGEAPTAAHPGATSPGAATGPAGTRSETLAMALSPAPGAPSDEAAGAKSTTSPAAAKGEAAPPASAAKPLTERTPAQVFADAQLALAKGDAAGLVELRRAANLGHAPAQLALARLYEDGKAGLPKDIVQARVWTERAAVQGDASAMFNLGLFFANGEGGTRNATSAVAWFHRAADAGVRDAQYNLAVMNQNGDGVPKNVAEAYKWFLVAAARGDAEARTTADQLKAQLTPEQQAAGQRAAAALTGQVTQAQSAAGATAAAPRPAVAN